MKTELANSEQVSPEIIQKLVLDGDLSKMSQQQKVDYYNRFCQSLGLNPLTQPFQLMKFQGKERLYATKDCTEQLRKIHGVSIIELTSQKLEDVYVVTAKARDKEGKVDASTGAVVIGSTKGDALANALMKAETKAKRRVTLSICGLGMLDEAELDTMPQHTTQKLEDAEATVTHAKTPAKNNQPKAITEKDGEGNFTKEWAHTIKQISSGKVTIERVKEVYILSEEQEKKLIEALPKTEEVTS